jgi:hypothetical protein
VSLLRSWQLLEYSYWRISHILWNPKIQYHVHNSPPLIPMLTRIHPVHTLLPYFLGKGEVNPCLIKCHTMKMYGRWGTDPHIFSLNRRSSWVVSFTLQLLYSWRRNAQYPLDWRLGGLQNWYGHCPHEKYPKPSSSVVQPRVLLIYRSVLLLWHDTWNVKQQSQKRRPIFRGQHRTRGISVVMRGHLATTSEDATHWEGLYIHCVD